MLCVRLYYDTCAPLHRPVYMYVHVRDQNDNAMYASTRWVPTVRQFLACENVAGGSQQSEGQIIFFCPDALPCVRRCSWWVLAVRGANRFFCPDAPCCVRRCSWWVRAVRGRIIFFARTHFLECEGVASGSQQSGDELFFFARTHFLACEGVAGGSQQSGGRIVFFARTHFLACEDEAGGSKQSGGNVFSTKYSGPSGGSQLSGGGIIIFRVIRRHFLAAAVDPAVSLSTYSPRPMEVVP